MFFPFLSHTKKTKWLIDFASQDAFYESIIKDLCAFGFHIDYPFWGRNGVYTPFAVVVDMVGKTYNDFVTELQNSVTQGDMKCHFSFSGRAGKNAIAHYWLHEVIHFLQDRYGLFLTPLQKKGEMPIILCPRSEIGLLLLCEAMAQTEAIRASWRLYKKGYKHAWYGAVLSLDWRGHALSYKKDLKSGIPEIHAARRNFDRWYHTLHRPYYEKRAIKMYEDNLTKFMSEAHITDMKKIFPFLRQCHLSDIIALLPENKRPNYLYLSDYPNIDDNYYHNIHNMYVVKKVSFLEEKIGVCHNPYFKDILIGSPPALWKGYITKINI